MTKHELDLLTELLVAGPLMPPTNANIKETREHCLNQYHQLEELRLLLTRYLITVFAHHQEEHEEDMGLVAQVTELRRHIQSWVELENAKIPAPPLHR